MRNYKSRVATLTLIGLMLVSGTISHSAEKERKLSVGFDYAAFKGGENHVFVELYFSVFLNSLEYIPSDDGRFKAEFEINTTLFDGDSVVAARDWRNMNYIDSLEQQLVKKKLFSVNSISAKPGKYDLQIKFTDIANGNTVENKLPVELTALPQDSFCMSDLQISSDIKRSTQKSQYYKNGYQVIPNTERVFGIGLPMLMFYFELYNLKQADEADDTKYTVQYSILNSDRAIVREFPAREKKKPGNSAVEVGGVNIVSLVSGTYTLNVKVTDPHTNSTISKDAKFFVYRQGDYEKMAMDSTQNDAVKSRQLIEGAYQVMSEAEIDEEFNATKYIASRDEKKIYKNLDIAGKRKFMVEFWAKRDKTPNTIRNEYRDDYLLRLRTANKEFSSSFRKGWKADEGRILLLYGVPDEIERFPSSTENKAYRIWHYFSVQGGVQFIFVDRRQWGEYELVHSTARGELYDQEWTRWIDPNQ